MLEAFWDKYIPEMIEFLRLNLKEPVKTVDNNIVQSLCRILDCFFVPFWDTEMV
jgi:dynein heavy chain, axonemal